MIDNSGALHASERRTFDARAGRFIGFVEKDVVRVLGVPYAVAGRFEAPLPAAPRVDANGVPAPFLAFHRSPASPQRSSRVLDTLLQGAFDGLTFSEHCQALSITLPADMAPDERLPVMVWIHGGSYVTGAGDLAIHDPYALVTEQRVVVVTVTYRLGLLGFLGDAESVPANLGLLDLLAALSWLQENIDAFGGAADSVTLFGQSAGGDAIAHLMISDGAAGLFHRAIIQSAPLRISGNRARMTRAMIRATGPLPCEAPAAKLLELQAKAERAARRFALRGRMAFGTQYGQPPLPAEADREEAWRSVAPLFDVLIGSTSHETGLYLPVIPVLRKLTRIPPIGSVVRRLLVQTTTQMIYTRAAHRFAERHRAAGGKATSYMLTWAPGDSHLGPVHMSDVPLLLGLQKAWERTALVGSKNWAEIDGFGRSIRKLWADFARTGTTPSVSTQVDKGISFNQS